MAKMTQQIHKDIVQQAEKILFTREEEGFEAALALWTKLDRALADCREELPDALFDLVMQLEFLIEGDPMADLNNARHALYVAQSSL